MNRTWLYAALVMTAALLAAHLWALSTFFYWYHRWFDIPMHIFGGAAIGAFLLALSITRRTPVYFLCMVGVVVGWEIFEYANHISTGQPDYWIDTVKDMVDGVLGSGITWAIARNTSWR